MSISNPHAKITLLYTNIGRGHPFYLDGIADELDRGDYSYTYEKIDLFQIVTGLSRQAWLLARYLYEQGGQENTLAKLYGHIRKNNNYNHPSFQLSILGRTLRKHFHNWPNPVVVAHPILAAILKDVCDLYYQHGEVVAPQEAIVTGLKTVFVPTRSVAQSFMANGYSSRLIVETGLCIEPALLPMAEAMVKQRFDRLRSKDPMTIAMFSSGAEPIQHIAKIVALAATFAQHNQQVIVYAKQHGKLYEMVQALTSSMKIPVSVVSSLDEISHIHSPLTLVTFQNRQEENQLTAKLFPSFDLFTAPSHERSNWALGLGLPILILEPAIGPFAPLNRDLLLARKVGFSISEITDAEKMYDFLSEYRQNGEVLALAEAGYGEYAVDGFRKIADFFDSYFEEISL